MDSDRRDLPRWQLAEDATLILDADYDVRCSLRDVSGSGIAIETDLKPEVGDEAIVYVRSLGRFKARVARVAKDHVAFRFMIENERQIVLLERLERRLVLEKEKNGGAASSQDASV
ncbi:PilZ domain-containing protein [Rhodospira trueperi]|uniref:PilZ domain-containing protein n=1 Tax=Rhodospira trueperi TaxID=69960 RepID=A0A1G7FZF5_9PROT|nr:PilZ domain-containing protein [Rhodospira trueperi]SDE81135.1 PilZ domain-containing protein [Rhodospira trueperi]